MRSGYGSYAGSLIGICVSLKLITTEFTVWWLWITLLKSSTVSVAMMIVPVPGGTSATVPPFAKFSWLLSMIQLAHARVPRQFGWAFAGGGGGPAPVPRQFGCAFAGSVCARQPYRWRPGLSKISRPPVLLVA